MKFLLKIFLMTMIGLLPLCAEDLTRSSVKQMIEDMDDAANDMNVVALAKRLHPHVKITMHVNINGKMQVMRVSKQQYVQLLTQGFQAATSHKHSVSNVKVVIKDDKAYCTLDTKETVEINGQSQTGNSKENFTVKLFEGQLYITAMDATTAI